MNSIVLNRLEEQDPKLNEAFKRLRTNILFCGADIKIIAMTSTMANEGKSQVSFELARAMAEAGKRVLFLDADIRKSVINHRYSVDRPVKGLSHYLAGQESIDNIVCETNLENLFMVFAGPVVPNPSELLASKRFQSMLDIVRKIFDFIIIDCPPLGAVIDAAIIAQKADGAVLVIDNNRISHRMAQRVKQQLEQSGCKILGAVLNKVDMKTKGYYSKYYGKYYGTYEY